MRLLYQLIIFFFFAVATAVAQSDESNVANIVPNPSFERYSGVPLGWFYKGKHFSTVMKYWNAPTGASPDIFGPKVIIPKHWAEKGFGEQQPKTGASMVGVTVYGCEEGKPHCREYIQIQLKEPLVISQHYYFEFWVSSLPRAIKTNNLGGYFSETEIKLTGDELIETNPQVRTTDIISSNSNRWTKISGSFQAKEEANYLIIGNFSTDQDTEIQAATASLNYGYYYIDDVLLKKQKPILKVPLKKDDLSNISLETGKIITLKNIFFETDKYELLPRSYIELGKLLKIMQQNPNMVIEIRGHTDIRGKVNYNQYLSRKRAKAVAIFLIENGIEPTRTQYKGFGSTRPIADNNTEEGLQLNRRVEFKILSNDVN